MVTPIMSQFMQSSAAFVSVTLSVHFKGCQKMFSGNNWKTKNKLAIGIEMLLCLIYIKYIWAMFTWLKTQQSECFHFSEGRWL